MSGTYGKKTNQQKGRGHFNEVSLYREEKKGIPRAPPLFGTNPQFNQHVNAYPNPNTPGFSRVHAQQFAKPQNPPFQVPNVVPTHAPQHQNVNSDGQINCAYVSHCKNSVRHKLSRMAAKDVTFHKIIGTVTLRGETVPLIENTEEGTKFVNGAGHFIEAAIREAYAEQKRGDKRPFLDLIAQNQNGWHYLQSVFAFFIPADPETFVKKELCVRKHPKSLGFKTCEHCGILCQVTKSKLSFYEKCPALQATSGAPNGAHKSHGHSQFEHGFQMPCFQGVSTETRELPSRFSGRPIIAAHRIAQSGFPHPPFNRRPKPTPSACSSSHAQEHEDNDSVSIADACHQMQEMLMYEAGTRSDHQDNQEDENEEDEGDAGDEDDGDDSAGESFSNSHETVEEERSNNVVVHT